MKIRNAWICQIVNETIKPVFGDLVISDGKIIEIYQNKPGVVDSSEENRDDIDANGRVVTIPNINFHDHFYSRLAKGLSIKDSMDNFLAILENLWWKLDMVLDTEMVKASAQMASLESIRNGVTYIFDHHSSPQASNGSLNVIADILGSFNLRGILCFEITDRNAKALAEKGVEENINFIQDSANENVKGMLGLHASFTLDDDSLKRASEIISEHNLGIHIHLCEDKTDRNESLRKYNNLPVDRLNKFGLLNDKSILAHAIHLKERDFKIIEQSGGAIVYNPSSNLNNAVGLPDFTYVPAKIPLLAGTDGMHANPSKSMKQLFLICRHRGMSFSEAFKFINKIYFDQIRFVKKYFSDFTSLNLKDRADLIIWDYIPPTPFTEESFWGHYIYGILERPVYTVVQNGNILLNNFQFSFNESDYSRIISEQGKRLYDKFNSSI